MSDRFADRARAVGRRSLQESGKAVDSAAKFAKRRRGAVVEATRDGLDFAGRMSQDAGRALARASSDVSRGQDVGSARPLRTTAEKLSDWTLSLGTVLGRSLERLGDSARMASPAIGEATGSVVVGTVSTIAGAVDAVAITRADFDDLEHRLASAGEQARSRSRRELSRIMAARRAGRRDELLDLLTIGGVTVADMVDDPGIVPPDVEHAFELAYPGLAATESFAEVAQRLPSEHLIGLVNGVKGKLFEVELVDRLNGGVLADGHHAELAASATQPGHDLLVLDAQGQTVDVLQAKATDSVAYVKDALERYPNIDIVTTSEVHGHLMALGLTEHVSDGGISEAALQDKVEAAAGVGEHLDAGDFVPSALGLAVIAFSAFTARDASWEARAAAFGDRAAKAGMAGAVAKAALIATNAWWLALAGGVGLRVMAGRGEAKRQRLDALKGIVESLEADNRRFGRGSQRLVRLPKVEMS